MKRILAFLLTVVLTLFCSVTAFAMELDDDTKQTHVDVYANHVNNTAWNVVSVDVSGNGSTILSDGTQITVSGAVEPGWQLVIDLIPEKDALDWIGGVTGDHVKSPQAFHIYYLDNNGNLINVDGISVTMKPGDALKNPVVYSLKADGSMELLSADVKNGTITFITDGSPYYVVGEKDSTIATLPPEIIKGKEQSIVAGENKELSFTSNAAFSDFIRVEIDGKTLDEKNYTVKEGSTIVTLKADYVATLSVGEHTIGIVSTNGTATTTFTVRAKTAIDNDTDSPQTGDNSHMALWIALLAASVFGLAGTAVYSKRKRER